MQSQQNSCMHLRPIFSRSAHFLNEKASHDRRELTSHVVAATILTDEVTAASVWAGFCCLRHNSLASFFQLPTNSLFFIILSTCFVRMPWHHVGVAGLEAATHTSHNRLLVATSVQLTRLAIRCKTFGIAFHFLDSLYKAFFGVSKLCVSN